MENNPTEVPCTIGELKAVLTNLAEGEFYYVDIDYKNVLLTMSNLDDLYEATTLIHLLLTKGCHKPLEVELSSPGTKEKTILKVGWD